MDRNPHGICTWDEKSDCENCPNLEKLHCKWDLKYLTTFVLLFLPFGISGFFGMIIVSLFIENWYILIGYVIFLFLFFGLVEIRLLCRHCPFYAENTKILHCLANHGLPKVWKYQPEPVSLLEKIFLIFCFVIFGGTPILVEIYGVWFLHVNSGVYGLFSFLLMVGMTISTIISVITFFIVLNLIFCPHCVNFSCPLNRVPKNLVDNYLVKNPVMKEAWEKKGYKIG